ncbi:Transmembrane protein 65 [Phytophthora pseudosyringae]|uniref:Transmembrane protein 65 n=1 Tax=Phytophthora pseudosyringae TaxID=221518 RepID=A0A8T1VXP7_9STRA|nr:Transmembrane protein 65 [Phytophthora pseudosyringae]
MSTIRRFRNVYAGPKTRKRTNAAFAGICRTKAPPRRSATTMLWGASSIEQMHQPAKPKGAVPKAPMRSKPKPKSTVDALVERFQSLSKAQRYNVITKVASNYTNELEKVLKTADTDHDGLLSHDQLRGLLTSRFRLRPVASSNPAASLSSRALAPPTRRQLKLVMIGSAIPFVGFGLVDNLILLVAGDAIETHFHSSYHMSMLCAAALGNTVADVVGLSLGGVIEPMARRLGIPDPMLSKAQATMSATLWCNFVASAGGITLGCLIGMIPLLFMNHDAYEEEQMGEPVSRNKDDDDALAALEVATSATKRWLGDKGTWPVLVTCVAAAGLCTAQCVRYLAGHPDVNWNKENRQDIFRYKEDVGADWQSHRRKIATMHKNVINEAKGLNN